MGVGGGIFWVGGGKGEFFMGGSVAVGEGECG